MPNGPDRLVIACPVCRSGRVAEATNHLTRLHPYPHQRQARAAAEDLAMAAHPAGWLVLAGGYGSGKSRNWARWRS
jgi:phage terminase large subunit-like protein